MFRQWFWMEHMINPCLVHGSSNLERCSTSKKLKLGSRFVCFVVVWYGSSYPDISGHLFIKKTPSYRYRYPIINLRRSDDRLRFFRESRYQLDCPFIMNRDPSSVHCDWVNRTITSVPVRQLRKLGQISPMNPVRTIMVQSKTLQSHAYRWEIWCSCLSRRIYCAKHCSEKE